MRANNQSQQSTKPQNLDHDALDFTAHTVSFEKNGQRCTGRCFGVVTMLQIWDVKNSRVVLVAPQTARILSEVN